MALSAEERAARKRERMLHTLECVGLVKARNLVCKELQKLVRLEAIEEDGLVSCVTCDWRGDYRDCHAGHFIPRTHPVTQFDRRNLSVQCVSCNVFLSANLAKYEEYMLATHGADVVEELKRLKREAKVWTRDELVDLKIEYMARIKELGG